MQPAKSDIDTEAEFFAQRFPEGSRYVKVFASESEVVPSTGLAAVRDLVATTNSSSAALPLAGAWGWVMGGRGWPCPPSTSGAVAGGSHGRNATGEQHGGAR